MTHNIYDIGLSNMSDDAILDYMEMVVKGVDTSAYRALIGLSIAVQKDCKLELVRHIAVCRKLKAIEPVRNNLDFAYLIGEIRSRHPLTIFNYIVDCFGDVNMFRLSIELDALEEYCIHEGVGQDAF